jgi:hypothetical protein
VTSGHRVVHAFVSSGTRVTMEGLPFVAAMACPPSVRCFA